MILYVAAPGDMLISFKAFGSQLMSLQSCSNLGAKDISKLSSQKNDNKCVSLTDFLSTILTIGCGWTIFPSVHKRLSWILLGAPYGNEHVFSCVVLSVSSKNDNGNAMLVTDLMLFGMFFISLSMFMKISFIWAALHNVYIAIQTIDNTRLVNLHNIIRQKVVVFTQILFL